MKCTDALQPAPMETDPHLFSSYDVRKLYTVKTRLADKDTIQNLENVRKFCRAYQDVDIDGMLDVMDPDAHYGTLWGVVRGPMSIGMALSEEQKYRISFTTTLKTITSNTFEREGYLQKMDGFGLRKLWNTFRRFPLRETFIVGPDSGRIIFRQLQLRAQVHY